MFGSIAPSRLWLVALVGLFAACAALSLSAAEPAADGVLVLRNGNVLSGVVSQTGEYYRIVSAGATLQVPASQVEMHCGTLNEAYEMRRRARGGTTADSHVELARWCLRNDLLEQAARELLDARTLDASHPALPSMETQLEQIVQNKARRQALASAAALPGVPVTGPEPPTALTKAPPFDVPDEAREQFVRSIQPMLIHTCATGGCHQPGSARRLQLNRWALDGNGNATFVRRNLAAVVDQICQEDPATSALLQYARREHGGGRRATSKPLDPFQQTMLVEWMNNATGFQPPEAVEGTQEGDGGGAGDVAGGQLGGAVRQAEPRGALPPLPAALTPVVAASSKQLAPFVPRDAFDAEIFNRRVASRPAATEPVAEAAPTESATAAPSQAPE